MPIAPSLLRWYDRTKRDLPWRREPTPYKTLVSELMLQQTTVAAVIPYFERFIRRFPTLASLAAASEDEVTALWSGLGYYARARNLRRAAVAAVDEHGGELPRTEAALGELPGLGPYTAAAVAAIAFGARTFALDGNGARVMARLGGVSDSIDLPATRLRLRAAGTREVPRGRPGDFTQAVMELGATVCTPRNPRCDDCPLGASCAARAAGTVDEIPRRTKRAARPVVRVACACVTDGARVLLVRRGRGLLAGTWSLPEAVVTSDRGVGRRARRGAPGGRRGRRPRQVGRAPRRRPARLHPPRRHRGGVSRRGRPRRSRARRSALGRAGRNARAGRLQLHPQDRGAGARIKTRQRGATVVERGVVRLGIYLVLLFAACAASGQVAPSLPGTFGSGEPLPAPVVPEPGKPSTTALNGPEFSGGPTNDPGGDADFAEAKARFDAGDGVAARPLLEAFHEHHAQHPARPAADLMLARLALARGDAETARGLLSPLTSPPPDEGTGASARYYLGLAETRLGKFAHARELLLPFLPPAGAAGPGDDSLVELRGALAEATAGLGDAPAAIELWDAYARGGHESGEGLRARAHHGARRAALCRCDGADLPRGAAQGARPCAARRRGGVGAARPRRQLGRGGDQLGDSVGAHGRRDRSAGRARRCRRAILDASVSSSRCRADFNRWVRRRCARPCWRRGLLPPRVCSSSCATRAATPSARARGSRTWRAANR